MVSRSPTFAAHDPLQARGLFLIGLGTGAATVLAIPARFGMPLRAVAGWNASALAMGALAWWLILRMDAAMTRRRAAEEDPGRRAVWAIVTVGSGFSLFVNVIVIQEAHVRAPAARETFALLCVAAVASSWILTHTAYTLRYAHLYYRDDGKGEGGLSFPGEAAPAYVDFAYFSFTIGMCFQVSDVAISSGLIRRAVLGHSLLSFAYNTAILAITLNLVLGIFR